MATNMKVWQIASPAASPTACAEFFLRHGVALLSPGDPGRWTPARYSGDFAARDWMEWFAETMSVGDALLLRTGATRICGVGLVASGYEYDERFDDVQGVDLQHYRRVHWYRLPGEYDFGESVFTKGRFSAVKKPAVLDYVRRFLASPPTHWQTADLPPLPPEEPLLEQVPEAIAQIAAEVQDYVGLVPNRDRFGNYPLEAEIVAHFVVPFLRALGWRPEHIALEWGNERKKPDVVVFRSLPRCAENCAFVIEAKSLGSGVEQAHKQTLGYLKQYGLKCPFVVTDGIRYRLYDETGAHIAYTNLFRLKKSAVEFLTRLKRP